jgi:serine/threonine protein kinase
MASKNGELSAIKHTALFPHHQLISTRLLREPTLLAELPPHPNLVAVKETIRTPGHFYLVEEYLGGYVTLEALLPMLSDSQPAILPTAAAETILSQLISAVHSIHVPLQICHRDIKPENILVHPETLQLKLLDFGLATHFSKSEPKLSTCCGSPAFHCPEIVRALASPPGTVMYMGPEVDAWTCGVTMLRCLTGQRFPLGASHSSMRGMAIRAQRAVASIADEGLRVKVGALLDMDGIKRMKRFEELVVEQEKCQGEPARDDKKFKSTTFIPAEPTHSIKLPILAPHLTADAVAHVTPGFMSPPATAGASRRTTPANSRPPSPNRSRSSTPAPHPKSQLSNIVAMNPTNQPPERVLSYIKYCLRCAGILYHSWPDASGHESKLGPPNLAGYFSSAPSPAPPVHTSDSGTAGFAEAIGFPLQPSMSPVTPLFPSFHLPDDRSEAFAHIQVFQCVIEVIESEEDKDGGEEQMSLVQSIMAAFGRKKQPIAPSTPTKQRPENKRSLSTPAKPRTGNAGGTSNPAVKSSSGKDGSVKCLAFHMIVRFPKVQTGGHAGTIKVGPSRNPSSMSLGQQVTMNNVATQGRHSRAHSGATMPNIEDVLLDGSGGENGKEPVLTINTAPLQSAGLLPFPRVAANRSPSSSRAPSRSRAKSHRGSARKAKVLIQVTDPRAEHFIRDALSVGGSIDSMEDDYFSHNHHHRHHVPSSANVDSSNVTTPLAESAEPITPSRGDQKRKLTSKVPTTLSHSVDLSNNTPRASEEIPRVSVNDGEVEEQRGRQLNKAKVRTERDSTLRAPSQLHKVAVMEEPINDEAFKQSITGLSTVLQTIVTSSRNNTPDVGPDTPSSSGQDSAGSYNPSAVLSMTEYNSGDARTETQARNLLNDILRTLQSAEESGPSALEDLISPLSFPLFAALSPALGLEAKSAPSTDGTEQSEVATLRGIASSALDIVARSASPREMFLATQERLEIISISKMPKPKSAIEQEDEVLTGDDQSLPVSNGKWSGGLETSGLMHFLSLVVPRIKTEKPFNFLQPLATSIPRSVRSSLRLPPALAQEASASDLGSNSNGSSHPNTPGSEGSKEIGDSLLQSSLDRIKAAAHEIAIALAELTKSLSSWTASFDDKETEKTRTLLHTLFLASVIALLPELPKLEGSSSLAEQHFNQWYPQYTFKRPSQQVKNIATSTNVLQPKIWELLKETVDNTLSLDLEQCAFRKPSGSAALTQESSSFAIITMGAFILHVNLLSRLSSEQGDISAPIKWTKDESLDRMTKAMPILRASLGSGVPVTLSVDGNNALGGTAHLSDASLSWILWCIQGINRESESCTLEESDFLTLVQMLSSHAALSPDAISRLISLTLVETILDKNVSPDLGREVLRDLVLESPFPQLKSASVGLTKRLMASDLHKSSDRYACKEMLESISSSLFSMPSNAPDPPTQDVSASKTYLDDSGAWLSECLGLIYLIAARDVNNQTGLLDEQSIQLIHSDLLQPLEKWIKQILAINPSSKEETELLLQCSLLSVALDRAEEALQAR